VISKESQEPAEPEAHLPGGEPATTSARRPVLALAVGLALLAALFALVLLQPEQEPRHQELRNLRFAEAESFARALESYKPTRPPLYPTVLWLTARTGLPPVAANLALLAATLALSWRVARRWIPGLSPWVPTLLVASLQVHTHMASRLMPENLFTPLALATLLLVGRGRAERAGSWGSALGQGAVLALACTTRLFGLFWLVPVAARHLLADARLTWRARLARTAGLAAVALVPVTLWCAHAKRETGFWSGQDRFRPRPNLEGPGDGIGGGWDSFVEQATLLAKVLYVDFLSPHSWARHSVVNEPYATGPVELGLLALLLAATLLGVRYALRLRAEPSTLPERLERDARAGLRLLLELTVVYFAMTLLLWTFGNNDKLYTRFLYPAYPLVILTATALWARVSRATTSALQRLPCRVLYVALVAVQLGRAAYLQATG
jgi:4-amino-4-deoxy-L-arabinose transferase-like glycosyltransferase